MDLFNDCSNHWDWDFRFSEISKFQRENENYEGYIKNINYYLPPKKYLQSIYFFLFQDDLEKEACIFKDSLLKLNDLDSIYYDIINNKVNSILSKLEKNNRYVQSKETKNLSSLTKHMMSVAYSNYTTESLINFNNLKNGIPILIINKQKHYLLIPEDFGFKTKFFNNKNDFIKNNIKIINSFHYV